MNEELTPEQKFAQDDPETLVPRELSRGGTRDDIVSDLIGLDRPPGIARAIVDRIADEFERFTASPESRARLVADKPKIRTFTNQPAAVNHTKAPWYRIGRHSTHNN